LFTNPESPSEPVFPMATNGFSLESRAVSRNTIRGYAMGIPVSSCQMGGISVNKSPHRVVLRDVQQDGAAEQASGTLSDIRQGCRLVPSFVQLYW
jgi:hypothetical protein